MPVSAQLTEEYLSLYSTLQVRENRQGDLDFVVNRILAQRPRYQAASDSSGVPWYVIAAIHALESSLNFTRHLHNGDPLTARTVQYPAGRPAQGQPPFTWEVSAADALEFDGASAQKDWSLPATLDFLERFNGTGYRQGGGQATTPPRRSPYLWSFSQHYEKGKYVADGQFSPTAVSAQCGAAVILHELERLGHFQFEGLPAAPPTATMGLPDFDQVTLRLGSQGSRVELLQKALNLLGFGPLDEDGDFGDMSEGAVVAYQRSKSIERTGRVGKTTWTSLQADLSPFRGSLPPLQPPSIAELSLAPGEVLSMGSQGPKVHSLEEALSTLGYALKVDGKFDRETEGAVKSFQADHRVGQSGKVGGQTLAALKQAHSLRAGRSPRTNGRLHAFYTSQAGYKQVEAAVLRFYSPFRSNGCVAFMSSALREIGCPVPFELDSNGDSISLVTLAFSQWLQRQGWLKIIDHKALLPGDICFTIDEPDFPGYPAHTYMFDRWIGSDFRNGMVVDNQAFTHPRNIFAFGDFNFSPFAYALRASD